MRTLFFLTLVVTSGCIFGGTPQDEVDSGAPGDDMPTRTDASSDDMAQPPVDLGADLPTVRDMLQPPADLGPGDWQRPAYNRRMEVSWSRSDPPVQNFVVPVSLPGSLPDGAQAGAAANWSTGAPLPSELDGRTIWVRVPDFGQSGSFWVYFDGPEDSSPLGDVWGEYTAVWHFSSASPARDSSGKGNNVGGVNVSDAGLIGEAALMPNGNGGPNILTGGSIDLAGAPSFTVEMWVNLNSNANQTSTNTIFDRWDSGDRLVWLRWEQPTNIGLLVANAEIEGESTTYPGGPTHLGLVVDGGTDTIRLYVNGQQAIERMFPANWAPYEQLPNFGNAWAGGGFMDEIRITLGPRPPEYFAAVARAYLRGDLGIFRYGPVEVRP